MPQTLLPGSIIAMTDQAVDCLLNEGDGDAALVYLQLLRRGTVRGLDWSAQRVDQALGKLRALGLAPREEPLPDPGPQDAPPPEYAMEDITRALKGESAFPALCDEVERRLGRKLSTNDLKILFTLYDHLALPVEVVLMLVGWCVEEYERRHGPGRRPPLSLIRKEGFIWARRGIDTMEQAEQHIQRLTRLRGREMEVLRLLDIPPRPLVEREQNYIAAWDEMGFDNGALRLAYEKTVMKKQSMDWRYMNGILRRWNEKGLHTEEAVRAGDRAGWTPGGARRPGGPEGSGEDRRVQEDMDRMRRLMEQMRREGK